MRFVVDAQLPPALAEFLTDEGHVAEHVFAVALTQAADREIWDYAARVGAVIVTKDEDFAARRAVTQTGPQILWLRIGNTTTPQVVSRVRSRMPELLDLLSRGEKVVELV